MTDKAAFAAPAINTPPVTTPAISTAVSTAAAVDTPATSTVAVTTPAAATTAVTTPAASTTAVTTPTTTGAHRVHMAKKKKPKLDKAEKKRLRHLAAINLKRRLMKEQLLRELAMTKKNLRYGKHQWEQILREIKVVEFREEIQDWSEKAERLVQKKDEKIQLLMKNIEETQEMQERSLTQYMDQIEYLKNCHKALRDAATELYNSQASDMLQDYFDEVDDIQEIQDKTKLNTENIMHATNTDYVERMKQKYEDYMEKMFNEVSTEVENRYILRDKTTKKMNDLHQQLLNYMKELQGDIVDVHKTENYLSFMQRQQNYVIESRKLNEIEKNSTRRISQLQAELLRVEADSNRKLYGLKLEQDYFLKLRSVIERSMEYDRLLTHEKMLKLSSESYMLIKKLKKRKEYGENLLKLAACCRKYQTEKEKVVPFIFPDDEDVDTTAEEIKQLGLSFDIAKMLDITEEELTEQMKIMSNFWRRCSDVKFQNLLLKREKEKLTEENERYQNIIRSMKKSQNVEDILDALNITPF